MIGFEHPEESQRDRLLRRLDWRFLLPDPQPASVAVACTGLLREATAALWPQVVELRDATGAELVVLTQPDPQTIRRAHSVLPDGGSLYCEWRGLRALRRSSVHGWLVASGFERIRFHAARPDPEAAPAVAWVPLDDDAAVRFFLASKARHRSALGRIAQWVRRLAWRGGGRFRLTSPLCVTASRAPDRASSSGVVPAGPIPVPLPQRIAGELSSTPRETYHGELSSLQLVLLTPGRSALNKLVFAAIPSGSTYPVAVIKLARSADAAPSLYGEAAALRDLAALQPALDGVPRFILFEEDGSAPFLAQSAIRGNRLESMLAGSGWEKLLDSATDWLAMLARRTRSDWEGDGLRRYVDESLNAFETNFRPVLDERQRHAVHAVVESIPGLPAVREHRDFSPWNVLFDEAGNPGVLDWESSVARGLPALDLVYFLTYSGFYRERARSAEDFSRAYRTIWGGGSEISEKARSAVVRYSSDLGMPSAAIAPLRLLTWMIHSASEYRRMIMVSPSPSPAMLRQSLFLRLLVEELSMGSAPPAGASAQ